jgi:hypothetical protein
MEYVLKTSLVEVIVSIKSEGDEKLHKENTFSKSTKRL